MTSTNLFLVAVICVLAIGVWMLVRRQMVAFKQVSDKVSSDLTEQFTVRVASMEAKLSDLKATVMPINAAVQGILVKELTHFHFPEMDALMKKIGPPSTLTAEEETKLAELLEQRTKDMGDEIPESERDAARMLPMIMKRATRELADPAPVELRLVTVIPTKDK